MSENELKKQQAIEECNALINDRVEILLHNLKAKENFKLYRQSIKDYSEHMDVDSYFQRLSEIHKEIFNNQIKKNTVNLKDYVNGLKLTGE